MLRAFLGDNREELIQRCRLKAAARRAPPDELRNGVALFLSELAASLPEAGPPAPATELPVAQTAATHGQELLRHGFSIEQVVHDYADLCQSITERDGQPRQHFDARDLAEQPSPA